MTSNEVKGLEPGQGRYALQLDTLGHIVADFHLLRMDDHVLLETDWLRRGPLREVLQKYIVADDASLRYKTYPAARARQRVLLNRDIIKMFEGLRVTESFLMKNNVREILFRKPAYLSGQ